MNTPTITNLPGGRRSLLRAVGAAVVVALTVATMSSAEVSAGSGDGTTTHIVRSGDTVQSIAQRYGVSADDIRAANGIVDDRLYRGARLIIDGDAAQGSGSAGSSAPSSYEVVAGDYLIRIASRHGISLQALLDANGIDRDAVIHPGDTLRIPGSAATSDSVVSSPRIVCPVPGATFMNDWGFPRGTTRFHQGTDLFAPHGTPIAAPVTGTLTFETTGRGGTTFTIVTPSGWVAYGAHMSATVGASRWVAAGETIGAVGDSGNAKGGDPHLHLSLSRGNGPVNGYPSVLAAC